MTSAGAAVDQRLRQLPHARRPDGVPARGNEEARLPDHRRRPHGPVRNPSQPRAHHQPGRLALRLPGLRRRRHAVGRPHRRPAGAGAAHAALAVRGARRRGRSADDCAFIPVCAGGCTVAAYNELGSIDKPNCHKTAIQAGARRRSRGRLPPSAPQPSTSYVTTTRHRTVQEDSMKNEKKQDKKGTLRPWLVDVVVDNLR